ncbi:hypothetical protein BFP72_06695 [Reichenbachiella sp. 5M10]|nr:hypothetical protein BFP72_06695 [Reichenbachiella sp. 5M10]
MDHILNTTVLLTLTFFAIPKLLGKPRSVSGFEQFERVLGLDADFFRLFTGISELGMAVLILIFSISGNKVVGKLAFVLLLVTMIAALGLEFFARSEPKIVLVGIAITLAIISIYKLQTVQLIDQSYRT